MNINGIGSQQSTIEALSALNGAGQSDASPATDGTGATPAASATVSKPGELLSKLSQLLQQDPAKFKQVTQQISDELKTAAQTASGPQASFLSKLSDNFAQAASSGSLSALTPDRGSESSGALSGHHHHHGGHHGGGGGGGGIESVVSTALQQVDQALSSSTSSAPSTNAGQ
jgi:hypothetical protein